MRVTRCSCRESSREFVVPRAAASNMEATCLVREHVTRTGNSGFLTLLLELPTAFSFTSYSSFPTCRGPMPDDDLIP